MTIDCVRPLNCRVLSRPSIEILPSNWLREEQSEQGLRENLAIWILVGNYNLDPCRGVLILLGMAGAQEDSRAATSQRLESMARSQQDS